MNYCIKSLPLLETHPVHFLFPFALLFIIIRYIDKLFADNKEQINYPEYVSNGKTISLPLLPKYYSVLELDFKKPISVEIINRAYQRQAYLSEDDRMRGYKPNYSLEEIQAAKAYLIDFCDYTGKWN